MTSAFAPLHVSTDAFPPQGRLAMWREIFGRNITSVDIDPVGEEPFRADVTFHALPRVGVAFGRRSPARYLIGKQQVSEDRNGFGISILTSGAARIAYLGRELMLEAGNAVVMSGADPSDSVMYRGGRVVTIALPRAEMSALVPKLSHAYGSLIPATHSPLRLLVRYLDMLRRDDFLTAPALAWKTATYVIDLAALAIGASTEATRLVEERGLGAARLLAIKADIVARLGDRDLSSSEIAAQHGVSPRYVQSLFEREGTTFSAFLLNARLARALQMLTGPVHDARRISAIGYECGFGDLSYFNRAFRRLYGATPSEVREQARMTR